MSKIDALELFIWLGQQNDLEAAIRGLNDFKLRGFHRWLTSLKPSGGVPLLMMSLVEVEASRRFLEGGDA